MATGKEMGKINKRRCDLCQSNDSPPYPLSLKPRISIFYWNKQLLLPKIQTE
jgi:hypothetical protein